MESPDEALPASFHQLLRFPSAEALSVAASLFTERAPARKGRWLVDDEGPAPYLEFGPGLVRFGRVDHARRERSEAGTFDVLRHLSKVREGEQGEPVGTAEGGLVAEVSLLDREASQRGEVLGWSGKSRARLIATVASLDLLPLVSGVLPPAMVTLTLPGDWRAVCPDAAAGAAMFHRWVRAYERRWDQPLRCIWKREFQRRGAPHWHLWLVPPGTHRGVGDFQRWLSQSWTHAVFGGGGDPDERARHLGAGTNLSFSEGLRAADPRRLAIYFLKETLGGEGKAYQNAPPADWAGQSVGRYWGVRGIPKALERVELDPMQAHRLWRALRKSAEAKRARVAVRVPRGVTAAGVVRYRTVHRRRHMGGPAGWVAVNDGAAAASQLARYWDLLQEAETREPGVPLFELHGHAGGHV